MCVVVEVLVGVAVVRIDVEVVVVFRGGVVDDDDDVIGVDNFVVVELDVDVDADVGGRRVGNRVVK